MMKIARKPVRAEERPPGQCPDQHPASGPPIQPLPHPPTRQRQPGYQAPTNARPETTRRERPAHHATQPTRTRHPRLVQTRCHGVQALQMPAPHARAKDQEYPPPPDRHGPWEWRAKPAASVGRCHPALAASAPDHQARTGWSSRQYPVPSTKQSANADRATAGSDRGFGDETTRPPEPCQYRAQVGFSPARRGVL